MARTPKIPGLRSWRKAAVGPGYRDCWELLRGSGTPLYVFAVPAKKSAGPITGYYGAHGASQAVTATLRTKTEVIKALRKWARERARTNPLTASETAFVRSEQRRATRAAQSDRGFERESQRAGDARGALTAGHAADIQEARASAYGHVADDFGTPRVERQRRVPRTNPLTAAETRDAIRMSKRAAKAPAHGPLDAHYNQGRADGIIDVAHEFGSGRSFDAEHRLAKRQMRHLGLRSNPGLAYEDLGPGDRVTILVPAGRGRQGVEYRERTGRVVLRGPAGWVLNLGGKHGTPGIATPENFVRATKGKPSERHHGFGTLGRRGNPVVDAPRSVTAPRRAPKSQKPTKRAPKRRNPSATLCRHTLPLAKGQHHKVTVCYPQGVFPSLKAAVLNIQKELRARFGRLKGAPVVRTATWAYTNQAQTRGRWTFAG